MITLDSKRYETDSTAAAKLHGLLPCQHCNASDWILIGETSVACCSCGTAVTVEDNLIDLLAPQEPLSTPVKQWNDYYRVLTGPRRGAGEWWRLSCWRQHLFSSLFNNLSGKLVIDFGCGTAIRVSSIAPICDYRYSYVGIDSSLGALRHAMEVMPGGLFIHGDVESLLLHPARADIVLSLGVLMYSQNFSKPLNQCLHVLKSGGILLLHEQIYRKSWGRFLGCLLRFQDQVYPDAQGISLGSLCDYLKQHGSLSRTHLSGSPLRKLFMKLCDGTPLQPLRPLAARVDSIWCNTIGKLLPSVGASEIQLVFQKS